nr:MAG TPA: Putative stress-responsive nuclear envelope protein [Caudoviricetes sp.]
MRPDNSWLKADIQAWLTTHGIAYETSDTKAILLEKAGE